MSAASAAPRRELSAGAKAWLIAGAAASFVLFLAASAFQPELSAGANKGANAVSRSPVGFAGLVRLLRADGVAVRFNTRPDPGRSVNPEALFVLTPAAQTSADEIRRLARGRRVLLIAPKWIVTPTPNVPGRLAALGRIAPAAVAAQVAAVLTPGAKGQVTVAEADEAAQPLIAKNPAAWRDPPDRFSTLRPVSSLRTVGGPGAKPVRVDAKERILLAMTTQGVSYAVADPDLLDNHALFDPAGARTAVRLIEELADGGPVVFDLTLPGVAGARSALRLAFTPPFLPATAGALLLAGLLGLMARDRFGALRRSGRAYAYGKRALVDTTASLLALAGREPRLAGRYADLARAQAAQATGLPAAATREATDAALNRIGRERGAGEWSPLSTEAKTVTTRAALMAFARRIHAWRTEMTLGRG